MKYPLNQQHILLLSFFNSLWHCSGQEHWTMLLQASSFNASGDWGIPGFSGTLPVLQPTHREEFLIKSQPMQGVLTYIFSPKDVQIKALGQGNGV